MSTEDQSNADRRIPLLLEVPAVVHFLSAEPLLGPIRVPRLSEISWIIAGAESGSSARSMDTEWVRSLRDQCLEAHTAFFFKQYGGRNPKALGRLLDGVEWSQFPNPNGELPQ